jgi:ATP-binding cassette subfamily C (CFTR/MRP) protein 1
MFTSLSLLLLLNSPLMQLFQSIPEFAAALGCVGRIQTFLVTPSRADHRLLMSIPSLPAILHVSRIQNRTSDDIELTDKNIARKISTSNIPTSTISVQDGEFGWVKGGVPILQDINLKISPSQLTIIVGPVASGKTTLLKALLGETPSSKGFVYISTLDFSFCDQTPWLLSQSVQKNIIGFASFEGSWYSSVVHACTLDEDIASFPKGDQTLIGSNGITLSGGQKQRLVNNAAFFSSKSVVTDMN